jgi:hypothetical protein
MTSTSYRSLLDRSSPNPVTGTVFRSPRNGLISHPQCDSIRLPCRADIPTRFIAAWHPKIRHNTLRTVHLRVQKAPFSDRCRT